MASARRLVSRLALRFSAIRYRDSGKDPSAFLDDHILIFYVFASGIYFYNLGYYARC